MNQKYIVIEPWKQSYPNPISLEKDEKITVDLSIKDNTPGWDNWIWGISSKGQSGWIPIQMLEIQDSLLVDKKEALVLEDYSANELTVDKGQVLVAGKILNGWVWCKDENENIEGWIPLDNVQVL